VILLDTHVVVWMLTAPEKLSPVARNAILEARKSDESIACSPISLYEIANAVRRRRLHIRSPIHEFITAIESRVVLAPMTPDVAICAAGLPDPFHGDPMDRIIAATAMVGGYTLITHDDRIRKAGLCKTLW
jgi:PIN domain nuclease of toxin-antitoxin system